MMDGIDRKPIGNIVCKLEMELKGYEIALQKKQVTDNSIQVFGGGATAYQQHLAPMTQADISGKCRR
jgi:hypothetical protein